MWKASPNQRTNSKSGCPFCSGHMASQFTSLKVLHPKLSQEWHPKKNQKLKPENVRPGSDKKVWWKCPKGMTMNGKQQSVVEYMERLSLLFRTQSIFQKFIII